MAMAAMAASVSGTCRAGPASLAAARSAVAGVRLGAPPAFRASALRLSSPPLTVMRAGGGPGANRGARPAADPAAAGGEEGDAGAKRGRGGGRPGKEGGRGGRQNKESDGFEERVVQIQRICKVVKGGKIIRFRAVVIVGDLKGKVGVGCAKAKEVIAAVQKSVVDAKKALTTVPLTKSASIPHRIEARFGASKVVLRPASEGTGVIAGGSVRLVLEMAGVQNALAKQIGGSNALNNARATIVAINSLRTFKEVAADRGLTVEELWA